MSTEQTEDEWQAVEDNLKALSIKEQAQSQHQSSKSLDLTGDNNGQAEPIDTALMNALLNPRERMVLFHIEDAILNFMKSNDRLMELPQCNSFRRLLYYRLGQRFGLCHTTTDQITETGERTIVLYKTATSSFPSVLLIDLAAQYPLDPTASDGGNYNNNNSTYSSNNSSGQQSPVPTFPPQGLALSNPAHSTNSTNVTRKVQVMKRKPVRTETSSTKSSTSSKNAQSVEDKERAYNEARARIFGETGTPDGGSTGGNNTPCPEDDGESGNNSGVCTPRSEVYGDMKNVSNSNTTTIASASGDVSSTTATRGSTPAYSNASLSNQSSNASLSAMGQEKSNNSSTKDGSATASTGIAEKRNLDVVPAYNNRNDSNNTFDNNNNNTRRNNNYNNNNNTRAQVRNIDAERSDPDFVRRSNVTRNTSGGNSGGSNNYYNNNGYSNGGNNYNNSNYNNQPRYNNNNNSPIPHSMPYGMDPQAVYLQQQQQMQMQQMQYNMQGLPPPQNTPESVQMQLQMQMQYQQMQLQMQMQQQQQQMMGANPYYPNHNIPTPQGYQMPNNGQSSPAPGASYGMPLPAYGAPYNNNNPSYANNYAPQYPPQPQPHQGNGRQKNNNGSNNNKQYKNDFPPLG